MKRSSPATFLLGTVALVLPGLASPRLFAADPPAPAAAATPAASPTPGEPVTKEKLSYAIGQDIGQTLKRQKIDVDPQITANALRDTLSGAPQQLTEAQARETITAFMRENQAKQQAAAKAAGDKAKGEGEAFLTANKGKEGVKTTASGLQYKVLKEGDGPMPKAEDSVKTNYRGTLTDGTEFDSSYKRNEPATFPVNGVIKGWTEALQLMKVGSKWQLFIPSELAYGERGTPGGPIPPNSALTFEIELLGIEGK